MTKPPPVPLAAAIASAAAALGELVLLDHDRAELARVRAELDVAQAELVRVRAELARVKVELAAERARHGGEATTKPGASRVPVRWVVVERDGERPLIPARITYAWCCAFRIEPSHVRKQIHGVRRSHFLRIARMWPALGFDLDAAGVAFRWIRYVAYGDGMVEQQARFEQIMRGERPKPAPHPRRARRRVRR